MVIPAISISKTFIVGAATGMVGFVLGRMTKTCNLTVQADDPFPSATGIYHAVHAGNQDAIAFLQFALDKAKQNDQEASGWVADYAAVEFYQEAAAAQLAAGHGTEARA